MHQSTKMLIKYFSERKDNRISNLHFELLLGVEILEDYEDFLKYDEFSNLLVLKYFVFY